MNDHLLFKATTDSTSTHIVVWLMLAGGIAYDILAVSFGWQTITSFVRVLDRESGMLIRWGWIALWFHFFLFYGWNTR